MGDPFARLASFRRSKFHRDRLLPPFPLISQRWRVHEADGPAEVTEAFPGETLDSSGLTSRQPSGVSVDGRATSEPTVIGSYRLLRKIGEGGMGQVWLAGNYAEAEKLNRETLAIRTEALSLLRQPLDHGLKPAGALDMEKDLHLKSLHGDPGFDALVADAKQRVAAAQKPK